MWRSEDVEFHERETSSKGEEVEGNPEVNYLQVAFNLALIASLAMFVGLLGVLFRAIRPYKNFERGVASVS